ncbi:MAG: metallophosphoesterase [Bacteroidales bacterium]|nr:metallophosphoesterase [Bacteroidales bacterium]
MKKILLAAALMGGILDFHPAEEVVPWLEGSRATLSVWGQPAPAPSLTLLQMSDLHGDAENLARVVEFKQAYGGYIEDAIHLGDAVYCYWDDPNPWDEVKGAEKILNTVGNHDCWKGHLLWAQSNRPYDATAEEAYSLIMEGKDKSAPFIDNWGVVSPGRGLCYYYKDYKQQNIRLIVLDCMHYDPAQDKWFTYVLEDAAAKGLTVVGAQHYPAWSGLDKIPGGFSDMDLDIPVMTSPSHLDTPGGPQMECMADEAFTRVDRFIEAGGIFACWLSGHTHLDFIGHIPGHSRQLQIIADKAGAKDGYMQEARTRGTRLQDAFNLVTINTSRGTLFVKRIGCDRDQYMRSKSYFTYNYLTGKVIVNE